VRTNKKNRVRPKDARLGVLENISFLRLMVINLVGMSQATTLLLNQKEFKSTQLRAILTNWIKIRILLTA